MGTQRKQWREVRLSSAHAHNTKILSCRGLIEIPLPFTRAKYSTSIHVTSENRLGAWLVKIHDACLIFLE